MKQFFGKLAAVMLVICMVLPVFAGGNKESAAPAGPVTISMAYGAGASEAGAPPADWVVPGIVSEKLGINLELSMLPSAQGDQDIAISASGAANDLPDIFMVSREVWMTLVNQGLVASVDDMYAMMPNRTKTHYTADSRNFTTINGKSYGLADPGSINKNEGLLIRKDWLDKLGLKTPSTIDELFAVMKAFTFNDPDGNGKADTYGYGAFLENTGALDYGLGRRLDPIMGAFGVEGPWNLSKNAAGLNVRKPEFYDAMVFLKKMVDEKVIDPNWMSYKKDDFRAAWKQGKFGVMREQNAAFAAEANYKAFDVNFPEGEWIVIDPPKGAGGKSSVGVYSPSYRIYAVSQKAADSGKKAKIAELLEWIASDGYYLVAYGQEGVNYKLDANGLPTATDTNLSFTKEGGIPYIQLKNLALYNGEVEMKIRYPTYTTATSKKQMSAYDVLVDMQSRKWTPCMGGDTLPKPSADLKRFLDQGLLEFLTGKRELTKDNWTSWVADFDKQGGTKWESDGLAAAKEKGLLY